RLDETQGPGISPVPAGRKGTRAAGRVEHRPGIIAPRVSIGRACAGQNVAGWSGRGVDSATIRSSPGQDAGSSVCWATSGIPVAERRTMGNPVVHFEVRSGNPDATRDFYGKLLDWTFADAPEPGYKFVVTGVDGAIPGGIGQA